MATRGFEHLTIEQAKGLGRSSVPKPSKYRNVTVVIDGETFDSKREAAYWHGLKAQVRAGEINSLHRQVEFALCAPDRTDLEHQHERAVIVAQYIADFTYYDRAGRRHVVDAKGHRTAIYRLKKKWLELQDGIVIEEV